MDRMTVSADVALLCYSTGEVFFITLPDNLKNSDSEVVEKYLHEHCGFNEDEISWMGSTGRFPVNFQAED